MTKVEKVLEHLQSGKTISSMEAFELYGATRLSAIIFDLKERGHDIETVMVDGHDRYGAKVRFARYRLKE